MLIESNSKLSAVTAHGRLEPNRVALNNIGTPSRSPIEIKREILSSQSELRPKTEDMVDPCPTDK